ncbi:MAG: hypothetical protein O9293_09595 [Porphyrobacter sp.]|nr:hypothetical protein [Porphyrobacter sp.]
MKTVSQAGQCIAPRRLLRAALEDDRADLLLKQECRGRSHRHNQQEPDGNPPHHNVPTFDDILALPMPLSKGFRLRVIENAHPANRRHQLAFTYVTSWRISRTTRAVAKGRLLNVGFRETN